ncbi:universal stress protein [Pelagibacterium limicola]|uniref:universal stress protein n=1 Tax=Pelagibacterium limicola TaxID=2791022 RepID=UPI0018AF9031|nr:universal stress protein [Pelagibacterium limicola]
MSNPLVAFVDGSIYSKSVCEHAAWLAKRMGSSVQILHVLGRRETPPSDLSGAIALGTRSALLEQLSELDAQRAKLARERGRVILEDAQSIVLKAGVSQVTTRLVSGDILETVGELEAGAAMMVIGKRGEAADFAKLHLGSNLERVVRASQKPVFVASRAFRPIGKVLVAFDGGVSNIKAVDHIAVSPLFRGLDITLLTVGGEGDDTARKLDYARGKLEQAGVSAVSEIRNGQPEVVIASAVEREGFDLLVMGAYGHSRIRNLLIGSTTTEMLRSCMVPVLLFR